jgi:hypothetical protein
MKLHNRERPSCLMASHLEDGHHAEVVDDLTFAISPVGHFAVFVAHSCLFPAPGTSRLEL